MSIKKKLSEWLVHLQTLHVRALDLSCGRVQCVAKALGIQQPACAVITVTGTNGKGSVVGLLEALYVSAGYQVGAFTSPYLITFNEQFRINQHWIRDEQLCEYFEKIEVARADIVLTFFEFKTLAVLLFFQEYNLDLWILEVGIGGRLDAVNIIDADIAVITSISCDHCEWLGETRELIAREKAGIFRPRKLAVCGDAFPPSTLAECAADLQVEIFYRNRDFYVHEQKDTWTWYGKKLIFTHLPFPVLLQDNVATALMVVELLATHSMLHQKSVSVKKIQEIIGITKIPGRLEIIALNPLMVLDVAHNEDSVRRLAHFLEQHQQKKVVAVFSLLKSKDLAAMVRVIAPYVIEWHIAELAHAQAMPVADIQKVLYTLPSTQVIQHASIAAAYQTVQNISYAARIIFGSFHVVSVVKEYRRAACCAT